MYLMIYMYIAYGRSMLKVLIDLCAIINKLISLQFVKVFLETDKSFIILAALFIAVQIENSSIHLPYSYSHFLLYTVLLYENI